MKKGFTLIELLVVIAIIAILATVVFVALNPAQRFQDTRNSRRSSDVTTILTAIHECIVDDNGNMDSTCGLTGDTFLSVEICGDTVDGCLDGLGDPFPASGACAGATEVGDFTALAGTYLGSLPIDPGGASDVVNTGYMVTATNGIITVEACHAEDGETIQVMR